jgi:hypothetical protein
MIASNAAAADLRIVPEPARRLPGWVGKAPGTPARPDSRRVGLRLTRRGRVVVTALAVGLALAAGSVAQRAAADTPGEAVQVTARTVTAGETLWQVASTITEPGEDVRAAVDLLMDLNGLASTGLQVGQQLLIPVS